MAEFVEPLLSEILKSCQDLLVTGLGDNPRDVKRFINTLTLNHQIASGSNISGYDPKILALLLMIQYRSPGLYREIEWEPALLRKLSQESKDTNKLREEYLSKDSRLKEVIAGLSKDGVPEEGLVKRYIYLTQVARVTEEIKTGTGKLDLKAVLAAHRLWLESVGKKGERANLREAILHRADLGGADLRGAHLGGADLRGADLRGAHLRWADLRGADLSVADLSVADLSGADLSVADLSVADLSRADLRGTNLSRADLRGTNLSEARGLTKDQIASAIIDEETVLPDDLRELLTHRKHTKRPAKPKRKKASGRQSAAKRKKG